MAGKKKTPDDENHVIDPQQDAVVAPLTEAPDGAVVEDYSPETIEKKSHAPFWLAALLAALIAAVALVQHYQKMDIWPVMQAYWQHVTGHVFDEVASSFNAPEEPPIKSIFVASPVTASSILPEAGPESELKIKPPVLQATVMANGADDPDVNAAMILPSLNEVAKGVDEGKVVDLTIAAKPVLPDLAASHVREQSSRLVDEALLMMSDNHQISEWALRATLLQLGLLMERGAAYDKALWQVREYMAEYYRHSGKPIPFSRLEAMAQYAREGMPTHYQIASEACDMAVALASMIRCSQHSEEARNPIIAILRRLSLRLVHWAREDDAADSLAFRWCDALKQGDWAHAMDLAVEIDHKIIPYKENAVVAQFKRLQQQVEDRTRQMRLLDDMLHDVATKEVAQ